MITKIFELLRKPIGLIVISTCLSGIFSNFSEAQTTRPTISPWLSMYNNRSGSSLPNYQAYVRPQMDMLKELQNQSNQIKSQGIQQRDLSQILEAPRLKPSISGSQPAGFRQYLHYYQGLPQGGVPNFSGGRRR
ncbi:MAG: hypothetical protein LBB88_09955 [Planctomycetaceae bacterium]|jgi:hypothetical protein|nr:hypothetical protein [Planctomycetaceae bacterium]